MTAPANSAALPPFAQGVFRIAGAGGEPVLLGSRCERCGCRSFPAVHLCPACLAATQELEFGSRGSIYSYTVVHTKPPLGLPAPYAVGYVDLADSGLRVFALLAADQLQRLRIGAPVRLGVAALGHDGHGNACLRPLFIPSAAEDGA